MKMVSVNICGIDVNFPFQPYECQIKYMEKVITCLQTGRHGVLESPTGTGKTLCLLCATLAWRETYIARLQLQRVGTLKESEFNRELGATLTAASGNLDPGGSWERGFVDAPKIIYASRTHSQISQAVAELKNTKYSPKICVLGSREQMCINSEVMKEETNNGKVHLCRIKVGARQCFYYNNLEASKATVPAGILDIEDLVSVGTEKRFCPYYMSRELKKEADLIFMPYNYVLDFKARNAHSIDLNNTVILLDEAHNVERVCEDNASFDLTSFDLASCIEDCQQCIELLLQKEEDGAENDEASPGDLTVEDASLMKNLFLRLEGVIHDVVLDQNGSVTKPVSFLFDELNSLNVNSQSRDQILDTIEKMGGMLAGNKTKSFQRKIYALDKIATIIRTLFSKSLDDDSCNNQLPKSTRAFYKVHIHTEQGDDRRKQKTLDVWTNKTDSKKEDGRTLSYWCFNPGLTMQELLSQGVRSLILTSGTLSPLVSFKQELAIRFDVELENTHVIGREQVFVGIVPQGPDGRKLNSSYQFRSTAEYQISLGNTIVNLARIIPHGVLVFFPSYPVMDMILAKWQDCGIWNRLGVNKGLHIEPRKKDALNEAMRQFYDNIQDSNMKGAIFFAVCRGKVSEGLDFANENGRAVVITGLPFPPSFDPKVILKKQYLDEQKNTNVISGKEWYRQQASRAVNQAIGRVIRHKDDYGAILLCDERFCYSDAKAHLPAWIKKQIKEYKEFGQAQRDLVAFFRDIQHKMGVSNITQKNKRKIEATVVDVDSSTQIKNKLQKTSYSTNTTTQSNNNSPTLANQQSVGGDVRSAAAHQSLANISVGVMKGSVFDSIKDTSIETSVKRTLLQTAAKPTVSTSISTTVQMKKKYKIVKSGQSSTKLESKEASELASSSRNTKVHDAKQYLTKVKSTLPRDRYEQFGDAMKLFKQTGNIKLLMSKFQDVFDRTNLEHISLLEGFSFFVGKSSDKIYFQQACEQFSDVKCIICLNEAFKPHLSPCQHVACYSCWRNSLKTGDATCPTCKAGFKMRKLKRIYMDGQTGLYGVDFTNLV